MKSKKDKWEAMQCLFRVCRDYAPFSIKTGARQLANKAARIVKKRAAMIC